MRARSRGHGGDRRDKWFGMARIGVSAAARMAFGIAIARVGGADAFALYVGLLTVEIVATTLLGAGWITPLGNLAPRLPELRRGPFLRAALVRTLGAAGWMVGVLLVGAPVATGLAGVPPSTYLAFCAATGAWLASTATAAALATGFRSARGLVGQSVGLVGSALGLIVARSSPLDPLTMYFVGAAVGHGVGAVWMLSAFPDRGAGLATAERAELARHGRVILAGSVANSVCTRIQPFVLAAVGGPAAVAAFGAANTLVGPARVFSGAVGEVLRPRLAQHQGRTGDAARARRAVRGALAGMSALAVGMLAAFVAAGEQIAVLVFGAEFAGLGRVLPWAALFVLVAATVNVLVVAMQTHSLAGTAAATRARIAAAVASALAVWPACAWDGARGAFVAMMVAELGFVAVALRHLAGVRRDAELATVGVPGA